LLEGPAGPQNDDRHAGNPPLSSGRRPRRSQGILTRSRAIRAGWRLTIELHTYIVVTMRRKTSPDVARKPYTFYLDADLQEGLRQVKERDGVSESEQIRRAIRLWLEEQGVNKPAVRSRRKHP